MESSSWKNFWGSSWRDVKNITRYISMHVHILASTARCVRDRESCIDKSSPTFAYTWRGSPSKGGNSWDGRRRISLKISNKCRCARPTRELTRKSNIPSTKYGKSDIPRYRRKCNYLGLCAWMYICGTKTETQREVNCPNQNIYACNLFKKRWFFWIKYIPDKFTR